VTTAKHKHRFREFVIDPSSDQYSASRLLLMVLVLGYLPALLSLEALGVRFSAWAQFALIVGSVAGAYGANSAARVWREGSVKPPPHKPEGDWP
jgi:hypothetical protein